jgi:uncharacterized membrane protein
MKLKKTSSQDLFFVVSSSIVAGLLIMYSFIRAGKLSFTYDEATTFLLIYSKNFNYLFCSANNHLLNSLFVWILSRYFGNSEFILRFPNILAHLIFLFYAFKLCQLIEFKGLRLFIFILLNINPFLLDYFSLSRGYGLSVACLSASLYFLVKDLNFSEVNGTDRDRFSSILWGALAVLANLSTLHYYLALVTAFVCLDFMKGRMKPFSKWLMHNLKSIIVCLVVGAVLVHFIRLMIEMRQLYFGGTNGFWEDSVNSLLYSCFYYKSYSVLVCRIIKGFIACVFVSGGLFGLYEWTIQKNPTRLSLLFIILAFAVISPILQFWLFKTRLPIERTALFYFPLFIFLLAFLLDEIVKTWNLRFVKGLILFMSITMTAIGIYHFSCTGNLNYAFYDRFNADSKEAMEVLKRIHEQKGGDIKIGSGWQQKTTIDYYRLKENCQWLSQTCIDQSWAADKFSRNAPFDVYLTYKDGNYGDVYNHQQLELVHEFKNSGLQIFKNLSPVTSQNILFRDYEDNRNSHSSDEKAYAGHFSYKIAGNEAFPEGFDISTDKFTNDSNLKVINASFFFYNTFSMTKNPAFVVISMEKQGETPYFYKTLDMSKLQLRDNQWNEISFCQRIPKIERKDDLLRIYIWHTGREAAYFDNFRIDIHTYTRMMDEIK